ELFRSIEDGDLESVDTYEVTAENDWELTIDELPAFDENGKAYTYEVEEEGIAEYNSSVNGFDITNTQKTYAIGDYVWVDKNKDGIQDDNEDPLEGVKVELYDEDGEKIAETETDEDGRYIFDELPAGDYKVKFELTEEQEEKYRFTKEQAGDDSTVDSDADEETGWTRDIVLDEDNEELTKEYDAQEFSATEGIDPTWDAGVIELVDIPVEKVWKDNDNAEESRPDAITVHVVVDGNEDPVAIGNLTAEDGWSHIFKGLDKYDENGGEINYSVEEEAVEGYKGEVEETEEGFVITNTEIIEQTPLEPSKTTVDVEKVWKGEKQDSVTIHLLANGEKVDEAILSENTDWKHAFTDLPVVHDITDEKAIKYTVEEVEIEGYSVEITGDAKEGFTITNTEIIEQTPLEPSKTTVDVEKVWKGEKQDSVTIHLLADGEKVEEVVLSEDTDWNYTFTDLPVVHNITDEKAIEYTVEEVEIEGYSVEIT